MMTTDPDYFYYRGNQLINILQGQGSNQSGQRFFQTATGLSAQINVGENAGTWLIGADALGSTLGGSDGENPEEHCYAPYGGEKRQGTTEGVMKLGHTGAYRDPLTGLYPLGNGYRCYLPELMCFNKADSLSPFGAGGINTRSYCEGDPINNSDPSGHAKKSWASHSGILMGIFGIVGAVFIGGALAIPMAVLGATAVVTGVTSVALPGKDEQAKDILGYISFGSGMASGLLGGVKRVAGEIAEKVIPPLQSGRLEGVLELGPSTDGIVEMNNPGAVESMGVSSDISGEEENFRGEFSRPATPVFGEAAVNPEAIEQLRRQVQTLGVDRVVPSTLRKYWEFPKTDLETGFAGARNLDQLQQAVQEASLQVKLRNERLGGEDIPMLYGIGPKKTLRALVFPGAMSYVKDPVLGSEPAMTKFEKDLYRHDRKRVLFSEVF